MKIKIRTADLLLAHDWTTAGNAAKRTRTVVLVELASNNGIAGVGEAAPSTRYNETLSSVMSFLRRVDPKRLSFDDVPGAMLYLNQLSPGDWAAKGAINIALMDGAVKSSGQAIYDFLGLGFRENKHVTSYTIGIDTPEKIRQKVLEAEPYPILKLKVGGAQDRESFAALREAAPQKVVRIDGNEGWATKEEALKNIEWFAQDKNVEFVEQPMPAKSRPQDMAWLKERSPMPVVADESYVNEKDLSLCADCFHGVNVKLVKTGGISGAFDALQAAKKAGLTRMIGCMIETSVLITAAAHLAELTNYLDIDTNLLITNDPFIGATAERGMISFANAPEKTGLRIKARGESLFCGV